MACATRTMNLSSAMKVLIMSSISALLMIESRVGPTRMGAAMSKRSSKAAQKKLLALGHNYDESKPKATTDSPNFQS